MPKEIKTFEAYEYWVKTTPEGLAHQLSVNPNPMFINAYNELIRKCLML